MATLNKAFVVALISVIVSPFLLFIEIVALMLADMIIVEPSNHLFIKIIALVVVILICAVTVVLPIIAFLMGKRARDSIKSSNTPMVGASKALATQVIAGVVLAVIVIVQIF
jgi:hypothetical protein